MKTYNFKQFYTQCEKDKKWTGTVDPSENELKLFFAGNDPFNFEAGDQCLFSPFTIHFLLSW